MDRLKLNNEIDGVRAELQRLHRERASLPSGDRPGASTLRATINRTSEDLKDLEAELAEFDKVEASDIRKAERTAGRTAAEAAVNCTANSIKLWATLQQQLAAARATAGELKALGQEAARHVHVALKAHSSAGIDAMHSKLGLLIPPAAASDTMTVEALASELKGLIDAMPGAPRITSEWLLPNLYAFTKATPGPVPSLVDARTRAAENLQASMRGVCQEPASVEERFALR